MLTTHRIELFVDNYIGVLDRILILVRRSGWNVKDLHVCEEKANNGTRIQFIIEGKADLTLLRAQLARLDCIQSQQIDCAPQAERELAMARSLDREGLAAAVRPWGARLIASGRQGDLYEFTGDSAQVDQFLKAITQAVPAQTARSGRIEL